MRGDVKNMKRANRKTVSLGIFTLLIAGSFFIQSFSIGKNGSGVTGIVGPATIPRVIILLIALAGIGCVWSESRREAKADGEESGKKRTVLSIALMTVLVLLLDIIGFLAAGILFLTGQILLTGGERPDRKQALRTLVMSAVCTLVMVLLFRYGFNIGISILPPVF